MTKFILTDLNLTVTNHSEPGPVSMDGKSREHQFKEVETEKTFSLSFDNSPMAITQQVHPKYLPILINLKELLNQEIERMKNGN